MSCHDARSTAHGTCVRCRLSDEIQDDLLALKRAHPRASLARIASDLGLSRHVVSVAIQQAMRRVR